MGKIIRVMPVPAGEYGEGKATKTQGTAVYAGDERISVQKLTLIAEPGDVWRAIIETTAQVDGAIVAVMASGDSSSKIGRVTLRDGQFREFQHCRDDSPFGPCVQFRPAPPPARLLCDACGDVTHKPHGWLCRAVSAIARFRVMAGIDRWMGAGSRDGEKR